MRPHARWTRPAGVTNVRCVIPQHPGDERGDLALLSAPERRAQIVRLVGTGTHVRVDELASEFGVSKMTVHRDLDTLAHQGRLMRVRGGARAAPGVLVERDVQQRRATQVTQKRALARRAGEMIDADDIIVLDDSSTVGAMLEFLPTDIDATVITHSLGIMHRFATEFEHVTLVGLGGQYYPATDSFLGVLSGPPPVELHANTVFVSTTALRRGVLCHPDAEAAATKRSLLDLADRKVLLVDSTKFDANGLYQIATLAEFDDVIVEDQLPEQHRASLEAFGHLGVHTVSTTD